MPPPTPEPPALSPEVAAGRLADFFKLLADKSRLKIVLALSQGGEMHVSALCELLGRPQQDISHHLKLMRIAGLVACRREGSYAYYRLAGGHTRGLLGQFFADSGNGSKAMHFGDFSLALQARGA